MNVSVSVSPCLASIRIGNVGRREWEIDTPYGPTNPPEEDQVIVIVTVAGYEFHVPSLA